MENKSVDLEKHASIVYRFISKGRFELAKTHVKRLAKMALPDRIYNAVLEGEFSTAEKLIDELKAYEKELAEKKLKDVEVKAEESTAPVKTTEEPVVETEAPTEVHDEEPRKPK